MSKKGSQGEIVFKNTLLIITREDAKLAVSKLRTKWNIPPAGFINNKQYRKWVLHLTNQLLFDSKYGSPSQYSLFLDDISIMCKELRLPIFWSSFFRIYVPTAETIDALHLRSGKTHNTPSVSIVSKGREDKIRLEFRANTNLQDIKTVWGKVKELQKTLPDYDPTRLRKNLLRDLNLLKQSKAGKTPKQIYNTLPTENPDDDLNLDAVSKATQRIKKFTKGQ